MWAGTGSCGATYPGVKRPFGAIEPGPGRGGDSTGELWDAGEPGAIGSRDSRLCGVKVIALVYLAGVVIWYERSMTQDKRYWYNVKTGQVEDGPQSFSTDRIGPFATREEAANALATYEARNRAWDEEDEADDDW